MSSLILMLLLAAPALSSQSSDVQVSEYHRLHQEMDRLAARQAWTGVERAYQAMLQTGVTPTARDAQHGAVAAMARGDLGAARARLLVVARSSEAHENRDAIEMLYRIDTEYGSVTLSGRAALQAEQAPFLPEAVAAVEFAAEAVQELGAFEGFLPPGRYRYGDEVVEVMAGVDTRFAVEGESLSRKERKKR